MPTAEGERWDGEQITKPGIYSNMHIDDYHRHDICAGPSISSSGLRLIIRRSPAHYWALSPLNPERMEDDEDEKRAFVIGRAMHHLALGEQTYALKFRTAPTHVPGADGVMREWSLRVNSAKSWLSECKARGLIGIFPKEYDQILGMSNALRNNPMVVAGALKGRVERSAFWQDRDSGVWLKCRPDVIPTASGDFVDLKTTGSVQWEDMQRTIHQLGYAQQFALMRTIFTHLKIPFASSTLIFIEKTKPHCIREVTLTDKQLNYGTEENRLALRIFCRCLESGEWPGPGGDRRTAETIWMPQWAVEQTESRLKMLREEDKAQQAWSTHGKQRSRSDDHHRATGTDD